ncbi:MAG: hypothetical protein ACYCZF_10435 [Anaerolineae bacterium]
MKISWRIDVSQWRPDTQFARLLTILQAHHGVVDEVSLFVGDVFTWHGYLPLDEFEAQIETTKSRVATLKASGVRRVGFNLWPSFGSEGRVGAELRPPLPFQGMVGYDGQVAYSIGCMNTAEFRTYWSTKFTLLAQEHPDFIWVDDDLRLTYLGIPYPCFCPTCLGLFQNGRWASREALVATLNEPAGAELRREWIDFNAASLESVCRVAETAVHTVDPRIELGLMTVGPTHTTYSGNFINRCMRALKSTTGRPGHGFYWDGRPRDLFTKALDVGRQIREYPAAVTEIQYEHEEYPYIVLEKAYQTVVNEITASLAMGCTGVAMNHFPLVPTQLDCYACLLARMADERARWQAYTSANAGTTLCGLWPAASPLLMANRAVDERGWFREDDPAYDVSTPNSWLEQGFAFSNRPETACGTLLAGRVVEALSDTEISTALSGAVIMDRTALQVLWQRGFGELTGVELGEKQVGVYEQLTDHPLNGLYTGDGRLSLDAGWALVPLNSQVQVLSRMVGLHGEECGPCVTAFANALGGPVVVMTYTPWHFIGVPGKWHQMRAMVDWATHSKMPIMLDRPLRVAPFIRLDTARKRCTIALMNNSLDATGSFEITVRAGCHSLNLVHTDGSLSTMPIHRTETGIVTAIDSIEPWKTVMILGE